MMLVRSINYNRSLPHLIRHFHIAKKLVLGWDCFSSSVPVSVTTPWFLQFDGTGSGTSVLVLISRYQGFCTNVSLGYLHFSHFSAGLVPF